MVEIWVWRIGGMILKWAAESFGENPVRVQLRPPPGIEENHLSHGTACFVGMYPCYSGIEGKFGRVGGENLLLLGFEPWTDQPVAQSLL
jgi:hypothetical protein